MSEASQWVSRSSVAVVICVLTYEWHHTRLTAVKGIFGAKETPFITYRPVGNKITKYNLTR